MFRLKIFVRVQAFRRAPPVQLLPPWLRSNLFSLTHSIHLSLPSNLSDDNLVTDQIELNPFFPLHIYETLAVYNPTHSPPSNYGVRSSTLSAIYYKLGI